MENSGTDGYGPGTRYQFGDFEIDIARFELRRAGAAVHVEPQVFDVLAYLIAHRDRVVPKAELLDARVGRPVRERVRAGQPDQGGPSQRRRRRRPSRRSIRTVFGRGYQFVAEVERRRRRPHGAGVGPTHRRCSWSQEIRFCQAARRHARSPTPSSATGRRW